MTDELENIKKLREISDHLIDPDLAAVMIESLPDAMIVVNDKGLIQLVNLRAELLFGYSRKELFDKPIEVLVPDHIKDRHIAHRNGFIDDPQTRPMGAKLDLAARRKDGTNVPVLINLSPIPTPNGVLVMAIIRRKGRDE